MYSLNKKAIENAILVIILFVALISVGLAFWSLKSPMPAPTAYVVEPQIIEPQAACQIDCDDGDASVNPGAQEVCDDLIDNNCDGEIDEGCCGNGVQEPGEQCDPPGSRCKQGGNEGICTAATVQQPCSCNTALCQFCGDGICAFDENAQSCNQDCDPVCGNLACEAGEGISCPQDCQADCGNGACEGGQHICQDGDCDCPGSQTECTETVSTCPNDCSTNSVCAGNALCQYNRNVYDPGDEGGFINCGVDCCSAACETDSDCTPNQNFPCVSGTCITETGFCDFVQIQGCCDSNDDCDDSNECTDDVCDDNECTNTNNQDPCTDGNACTDDICSGGICVGTPINCADQDVCTQDHCDVDTGCSNPPQNCDDENPCTVDTCVPLQGPDSIIPQNGDFECTHVFSASLCPPSVGGGGGGGGSNPYVQEACCGPCVNGKGKCKGVMILDGSCRVNTNTQCSTPLPSSAEVPPQAPANPSYFNQVSTSSGKGSLPPELPAEEALARQQALAGQVQYPEQASRRSEASRASIEGAMARQASSTAPSALALLLLVALLLGSYAYFNKEKISSFFNKKEKKVEPIVKDIRKSWNKITHLKKAKSKRK